ncbi:hypothetical protein FRC09_013100 [Ceratobasidium sp. 395]|nr:hypothetical protein FRC09_013100 [Ceratobasidium sp. 395]
MERRSTSAASKSTNRSVSASSAAASTSRVPPVVDPVKDWHKTSVSSQGSAEKPTTPFVPTPDVIQRNELMVNALKNAPGALQTRFRHFGQLGVLGWSSEFSELVDEIQRCGLERQMFTTTREQALATCRDLLRLRVEVSMQMISIATANMSPPRSFTNELVALLAICPLVFGATDCHPKHPAWRGQARPPHEHSAQSCGRPFTPYYVPNGSFSIDDDHKSIKYSAGHWNHTKNPSAVGGSSHVSNVPGANITVKFTGTGIEWFGEMSRNHKLSEVFLDGMSAGTMSLFSETAYSQQRLFGVAHLESKEHTLTIVNDKSGKGSLIDVDAFVITTGIPGHKPLKAMGVHTRGAAWTLEQRGETGVSAMQVAIVSETEAILIDKVEHNPLSVNGHPAWGAIYNLEANTVRPLDMQTNSFCAGGGFIGNGTLINVGGNPVVEDTTGSADFGDEDGLQAIRLYNPCGDGTCDIYENPGLRMQTSRWYTSTTRLDDGSAMIIGGALHGDWINNEDNNNPTIEYFPPKPFGNNGVVGLQFLEDTLNSNLFPISFLLPDGRVFMAANNDAMIYDWRQDKEHRLPPIPNGVRVTYPMSGTSVLLPLSAANNYQPEVLICGGSALDDRTPPEELSAQDPASKQCARMVLTHAGIKAGWAVEYMPDARVMPDAVLLPDGRVVIVNGGRSGVAGYGNTRDQVGSSNADNPVYTPVLYDPAAPIGQRFSNAGMPTSYIARLYHSVATLTPEGSIMIAGSNPNLDRSNVRYDTEYRVEWLRPDYMNAPRPRYSRLPDRILFGKTFQLEVELPKGTREVKVSLMDLGFVTHNVHMNSRLVQLESSLAEDGRSLTIHAPPSGLVYPPGPGWIYVLADGIPSTGRKVMVGDGGNPP